MMLHDNETDTWMEWSSYSQRCGNCSGLLFFIPEFYTYLLLKFTPVPLKIMTGIPYTCSASQWAGANIMDDSHTCDTAVTFSASGVNMHLR